MELSRIKTTLIYNRFDLWQENVKWKIIKVSQQENEEAKYLQVKLDNKICGNLSFTDYVIGEAAEKVLFKLIQVFWNYKNVSYGSDYAMTEQEYIKKYHVTDIYELKFGNTIAAVLLSCEQGTDVFLENFSFDNKLSKQSPGMIIYNLYLKMLAKKQKERLKESGICYNSQIPPGEISTYCKTSEEAEKMLQGAFEKLHLSGRACNRILRVARTAADLAGKEQIEEEEIAEAIGYRSFDKHSWK